MRLLVPFGEGERKRSFFFANEGGAGEELQRFSLTSVSAALSLLSNVARKCLSSESLNFPKTGPADVPGS